MTHSRKSAAQRAKSLERLRTFQAPPPMRPWGKAPDARPAPPPPPDFGIKTLEATVWSEGDRYPRWLFPTHSGGSRLAFNRNRPNPTDD